MRLDNRFPCLRKSTETTLDWALSLTLMVSTPDNYYPTLISMIRSHQCLISGMTPTKKPFQLLVV
jgi:hypothetical protein